MRRKTLKPKVRIISLILCISTLSSCSIVRGLRTDGKNGPNIFSFEKREHDTIATGDVVFRFPVAQKQADWIDTTHFYHKAHPCGPMTFGEAFDKESSTQGIVIIHNDSIVYERYWGDFSADRMATIFSISKSITSLLCGIAVDDGYIRSIDDPVTDYLPELKKKDPMWQKLTIRHLLDMRSGLDFDDTYEFTSLKVSEPYLSGGSLWSHFNNISLISIILIGCFIVARFHSDAVYLSKVGTKWVHVPDCCLLQSICKNTTFFSHGSFFSFFGNCLVVACGQTG